MNQKIKNYTFSLPIDMVDKVREFAEEKYIASINAGIKEALNDYIKKMERDMLKKEMKNASEDPLFLQDIYECIADFKDTDDEIGGEGYDW
ncbi:MAG: hypothetical protein GX154_11480 [Clostridiales bacterium]|nr:hypothetical protein [Clostridiales bacterium]